MLLLLLCKSNQFINIFWYGFKKNEISQGKKNLVERAIEEVTGFEELYCRFRRNVSVLGRSIKTFESYGRHLAAISLHFGRTPLELDAEDVQEYLYELQNRSQTPSQTYFKHTVFSLRFLRLLYGCGLRCFEVRNVRLRDLDFDRKVLHVVQGKGKKDRYLPLSEHLIRGLKSYIAAEKPQDWLFNGQPTARSDGDFDNRYSQRGVQWVVKQAAKTAGISKDVHVHTLRHTFATHLLEDGLDILTVKDLMGHVRIETTMEYLHVARSNPQRAFSPLDTLFAQCVPQRK
jgi:site-specific recombinase XerD